MFKPIAPQRRYQQIAEAISQEIHAGSFKPGSRLPAERDLAQQFGVSRPTIREALIALEIMGLIEIRVGAGVFVSQTSARKSIDITANPGPFEIMEARVYLEGEIAALAAARISEAQIDQLELSVQIYESENQNNYSSLRGDVMFHTTLAESTGNGVFIELVRYCLEQAHKNPLYTHLHTRISMSAVRANAIDEHIRIIAALRERSPKEARRTMHEHLGRVMRSLFDSWSAVDLAREPDPGSPRPARVTDRR